MAKRGRTPSPPPDPEEARKLGQALSWARLVTALVDRIGWPGLLVVFVFGSTQCWSTGEQKTRFIEMYILGNGIQHVWPIVLLGVIFAATTLAQYRIFTKKIKVLTDELMRVGDQKSELQQELTERRLQRGSKLLPPREGTRDADSDR